MKPPYFDLLVPETVKTVTAALKEYGENAKIIAGGQSLMALLNMRLVKPQMLIDISRLSDLHYIRKDSDVVEIGSAVTQAELEDWSDLKTELPLLADMLPYVGHFQTRNRGTVCGSLCHADPSSELPLALAILGGEVVLTSQRGKRILKAHEFQVGMLSTACKPTEFVSAVRFPVARSGQGYAFREVARRHGDFAVVALAAVADDKRVRMGVGGVAEKPAILDLPHYDEGELDKRLNDFAWSLAARDDIHSSARYRRELVRRLGRTTMEEAHNAAA